MRIGLVIQSGVELGGAHNYEANFRKLLLKVASQLGHSVITFTPRVSAKTNMQGEDVVSFRSSSLRFAVAHLRSQPLLLTAMRLIGLGQSNLEKKAIKQRVDILLFASPNHLSPGIHRLPIATTAWDFGHLDLPHYPETGQNGLWKWREELYTSTVSRSVAIFCDSSSTKLRLVERYGAQENRIHVVGLFPSVPDEVIPEKLDKPHFIYPAMFWPHKNHKLLLEAFAKFVSEHGPVAYLVLTGSGELQQRISSQAQSLGLSEQVRFMGLVPRAKLMSLLAGSQGLLMPSLLGPSNIPPLEAALLNVPVVASDVHQMEEMLYGLETVGSAEAEQWTAAMKDLWESKIGVPRILDQKEEERLEESLKLMDRQLQGLK
jgi:glycosyltransferase involved in cell wall biosynthesis